MPREFNRSDRVAAQIQRELAHLIRTVIRDPRLGLITVSDVEVSRDLAVAKVYVTFLAAQEPVSQCLQQMAAKAPTLRHELAHCMRMRTIPELRFFYDDSIERGMHMDALLERLEPNRPESGESE